VPHNLGSDYKVSSESGPVSAGLSFWSVSPRHLKWIAEAASRAVCLAPDSTLDE